MSDFSILEEALGRKLDKHDILDLRNNNTLSKAFYKEAKENYKKYKEDLANTLEKHLIVHKNRIEEEQQAFDDEKKAIEEAIYEETLKRDAERKEREAALKAEKERQMELGKLRFDEFEEMKQAAMNLINNSLAEYNEWEKRKVGPNHPDREKWESERPELITVDNYSIDTWKRLH